jgi:hypothetical protein
MHRLDYMERETTEGLELVVYPRGSMCGFPSFFCVHFLLDYMEQETAEGLWVTIYTAYTLQELHLCLYK